MDFFEQQEQARRETKRLVVYFVFAVASIVFAVYLVVGPAALIFSEPKSRRYEAVAQLFSLLFSDPFGFLRWVWHPALFLCVATGTVVVIAIGSIYKIHELSEGGSAVASLLGGRLINTHTTDPAEQRLRNVVEEMSIAAGTPVPEIYVLDGEPGINAFAAGHSTSDAAIGVTHGCLNILNRDELQAVIAHEFSHVLNGDMRLDMRMIGLLNGILCLAVIGKLMLRVTFGPATSENRRAFSINSLPLALLGLALLVVGSIGVFFGRLIKSAICRQREFLADAAAVQFTRHADALVSALKKWAVTRAVPASTQCREKPSARFSLATVCLASSPGSSPRIRRWKKEFAHSIRRLTAIIRKLNRRRSRQPKWKTCKRRRMRPCSLPPRTPANPFW